VSGFISGAFAAFFVLMVFKGYQTVRKIQQRDKKLMKDTTTLEDFEAMKGDGHP
jgi:hypothetical protein